MSHAPMGEEGRKNAGIGDDLILLSIGLEDADDLIEDIDKALSNA